MIIPLYHHLLMGGCLSINTLLGLRGIVEVYVAYKKHVPEEDKKICFLDTP